MRAWRVLIALALVCGITATSVRRAAAQAVESSVDQRYAIALQRFNPALDDATALALADTTIRQADAQALDARLLVALIAVESRWDRFALSTAGARGLGQLMPGTAAALGVNPDDPDANIAGAARHLRALLDRFAGYAQPERYRFALAAYNAGAAAVLRYGGVPPYRETRTYVRLVMRLWDRLAGR